MDMVNVVYNRQKDDVGRPVFHGSSLGFAVMQNLVLDGRANQCVVRKLRSICDGDEAESPIIGKNLRITLL